MNASNPFEPGGEIGKPRVLTGLSLLILGLLFSAEAAYPIPYAEDFEVPLVHGTPIRQVGAWESGTLDGSAIHSNVYNFTKTVRPIRSSADSQILELDTRSSALTNSFEVLDADQMVYLDAMLRLLPRSSIPDSVTDDPSVQLFFYLNSETNLVVYHGGENGTGPMQTVLLLSGVVFNEWNRFTVTLDFVHGDDAPTERKYFKVQINGVDLSCAQAYSAPGRVGAFDGGAWFFTADQAGPDSIQSLAFEGIGGLDDLVATARAPLFTTTQVFYVTSDLSGPGAMTPAVEVPVIGGSATQVVYQAAPWHEISSFLQNGMNIPDAAGSQVYTAVVSNVRADITHQVQFSEILAAADGKTPAGWYGPLGADGSMVDEDGDGLTLNEEYWLNSNPAISNSFTVVRIRYGAGNQMPVVGWESEGLPYGRIVPEMSTNLVQGGWVELSGILTQEGAVTTWQAPGNVPEGAFFLRLKAME